MHCLLQDSTGDIWIGTDSAGLDRWHEGKLSAFTTDSGLPDNHIQALTESPDGQLWIGTHHGLSSYRSGVFHNFSTADGLPNDYIRSLLADKDGGVWVGTNGGLSQFAKGRFRNFSGKDGLSSNSVSSLAFGENGSLWIGTMGGGVTRFRDGQFFPYSSHDGLPMKDIWAVLCDSTGNIWIGTGGGGLVRLESQSLLATYGTAEGLPSDVALPILQDHQGTIWIGTNGGGLGRFRQGEFSSLTVQQGLADNAVFSLGEEQDGTLWIGTRKGISLYKDGAFQKTYTSEDGLPGTAVVLYPDSSGAMWIGTRAGLVRWKNGKFKTFTIKDGLSSDVIRTIYEDRSHRIWVGTAGGGLDLYADNRFKVFDRRSGLSSNVVLSLYETPDRNLWIGTDGGGLDSFRNGRFVSFTSRDGLLDDSIFRILPDRQGNLWMSSNKGIARVRESELNDFAAGRITRIPVLSYGTGDGMRTRECNGGFQPAGWNATDGTLWFPTMKGVVVVDPSKLVTNAPQQVTVIEKILVNQQVILPGTLADVPVGGGNLQVDYTAVNFRSPSRINFEYRLLGFETEWVPAYRRRIATYTNLPPGHYRFQVRATNEDNSWSAAEAAFPLSLRPHFYQTFLFYVICSLSLVGFAGFAHRAYVRQLRERERTLEQHVHQRTAELRKEMAERELAQRESIRAREAAEQASRVKSEFLANMSHEIRTPMNGILGMTSLALTTAQDPKQKQYLEIIKDSADALLVVIDDILDFSKVEAGKLELNAIDFNVRQAMETMIKALAFRAEQKEVGLSCHVDPQVPAVVHSDPLRLRQVILNLLGNALKFTDRGEVTLAVYCDDRVRSEATLRFVVSDTGIGIAQEKLASIFEAFSQADSSTTRKYGGTGLGLAICHRMVHLMGGDIWATSEVGKGSQFHFTTKVSVPARGAIQAESTPEAIEHGQSLSALAGLLRSEVRVLLAEDNPANRMVAKFTLEAAGFQVQAVENGREALEAVQRARFDLILMDCRMPVMDGYVATEKIRQLDSRASLIPIIALTASAFQEDRNMAQRAGMNDFLAKPFADGDLIAKCVTWLKEAGLSGPGPADVLETTPVEPIANSRPASLAERLGRYSPEFLREMLEVFLQSAPPVFVRLQDALARHDWADAREAAHWLRGGGTRMAGPELQQQFAVLEARLREEHPAVSESEMDALTKLFHENCAEAELWLSQNLARNQVPVSSD